MVIAKKALGLCLMFIACLVCISSCHDTIDVVDPTIRDLTHIPYQPVPYLPQVPVNFPSLEQPADNPMTIEGIRLGRLLFYDPILSIDSTISCSSCHKQAFSFTDDL